jgi:hypothetical protein
LLVRRTGLKVDAVGERRESGYRRKAKRNAGRGRRLRDYGHDGQRE